MAPSYTAVTQIMHHTNDTVCRHDGVIICGHVSSMYEARFLHTSLCFEHACRQSLYDPCNESVLPWRNAPEAVERALGNRFWTSDTVRCALLYALRICKSYVVAHAQFVPEGSSYRIGSARKVPRKVLRLRLVWRIRSLTTSLRLKAYIECVTVVVYEILNNEGKILRLDKRKNAPMTYNDLRNQVHAALLPTSCRPNSRPSDSVITVVSARCHGRLEHNPVTQVLYVYQRSSPL